MARTSRDKFLRSVLICAAIWATAAVANAGEPGMDAATALRARYTALRSTPGQGSAQEGLYVESADDSRAPRGDAYAIVELPFSTVTRAFRSPATLCESLILHLNVQYCRGVESGGVPALSLALGRKTIQPLADTHHVLLDFNRQAESTDYMRVELAADEGPLDTGDYLIVMELAAQDERSTFMHIRYAYRQGLLARVATSLYFATGGRDKVGFTLESAPDGREPRLVRGIQGVLERNTMRYLLAFTAWLHTQDLPPAQRFEASLERWFADTERFARQLHELPHDEYIAIKRSQYQRQQDTLLASR